MHISHRTAAFAAALTVFGGAAFADSVAPATYSDTLAIGESVTIKKTVTVDAGRPDSAKVDVFFLADTTGSMSGQIGAAKTNAGTILSSLSSLGDVQFGVGEYKDTTDVFDYRTNTALTGDTTAVTNGVNLWSAGGGGDFPEGNLIGLERVAQDTAWRSGSTRVIVMFGDAPGHDPRGGSTEGSAIAALNDKGITVQIGNTAGTALSAMNSAVDGKPAGQANRIAAATGGGVFTLASSGAGIADLIKDAVDATFASYSSVSLEPVGNLPGVGVTVSDPILGTFDREATRTFDFDVTFTGLATGTHDFVINALVDGGIVGAETDSITVGEGGGDPDPGPGPGPSPVPLPAGLPLLLGALGGLGLAARRRKS